MASNTFVSDGVEHIGKNLGRGSYYIAYFSNDSAGAIRPGDIFVLTRTWKEARTIILGYVVYVIVWAGYIKHKGAWD